MHDHPRCSQAAQQHPLRLRQGGSPSHAQGQLAPPRRRSPAVGCHAGTVWMSQVHGVHPHHHLQARCPMQAPQKLRPPGGLPWLTFGVQGDGRQMTACLHAHRVSMYIRLMICGQLPRMRVRDFLGTGWCAAEVGRDRSWCNECVLAHTDAYARHRRIDGTNQHTNCGEALPLCAAERPVRRKPESSDPAFRHGNAEVLGIDCQTAGVPLPR